MLDATSQAQRLAFVIQQLSRFSGPKKKLGSDATLIVCPFHADKDPSGRVNHKSSSRSPGWFKCYGCGATAKWNELAPVIGLEPYGHQKPKDQFALELKFLVNGDAAEEEARKKKLIITGDIPRDKRWRTIPTNMLIDIGGKMCKMHYLDNDFYTEPFLYLPCIVRGRTRGYIRARMKKVKDKPSYLNSSGAWSLRYGFFPFDYAISMMKNQGHRVIVLVEGPRDALRLLKLGIPAMAILGTQSWSEAKSRILELGGVDTVLLFLDGDRAGRKANKLLKAKMTGMFNVHSFLLPVDENEWDPGNCPLWMLNKLKRKLECLS